MGQGIGMGLAHQPVALVMLIVATTRPVNCVDSLLGPPAIPEPMSMTAVRVPQCQYDPKFSTRPEH